MMEQVTPRMRILAQRKIEEERRLKREAKKKAKNTPEHVTKLRAGHTDTQYRRLNRVITETFMLITPAQRRKIINRLNDLNTAAEQTEAYLEGSELI